MEASCSVIRQARDSDRAYDSTSSGKLPHPVTDRSVLWCSTTTDASVATDNLTRKKKEKEEEKRGKEKETPALSLVKGPPPLGFPHARIP